MEHADLAGRLTTLLSLDRPPVGLTFVAEAPEDVPAADKAVPSACTFWRAAEQGVFYASAEQHFNCPVGSMVMGFDLPESVMTQLGGLVQSMCDARYLEAEEAAKIPSVGRQNAGIVYGPFGQGPLDPDLVVLWLTPAQLMLFNEAAGTASWMAEAPMDVSGRPGCAALPLAMNNDQPRASLGCIGMRTFTEIPGDRILVVLPGSRVPEFVTALETTVQSNAVMREFYQGHKAAIG
jgi:uncharacterized protein (DUF169 family)